jgi:hypothetical protein
MEMTKLKRMNVAVKVSSKEKEKICAIKCGMSTVIYIYSDLLQILLSRHLILYKKTNNDPH